MKANLVIFNQRLKEVVATSNLQQNEIAKRAGITESMLSDYLRMRFTPRFVTVHKLAEALNINPYWLGGITHEPSLLTSLQEPRYTREDLIKICEELNGYSFNEEIFVSKYEAALTHMLKLNPVGLDLLIRLSRDLSDLNRYNGYSLNTNNEILTTKTSEGLD